MSNFKGKRMVSEDLIKKLENLQPGGGGDYEPGNGIDITDGVLSVDYGAGLTVDNGTLIVDSSAVAMKSNLATVAMTGDYDDLTNKPTIPVTITVDTTQTDTLTPEQLASIEYGCEIIVVDGSNEHKYTCETLDNSTAMFFDNKYTILPNTNAVQYDLIRNICVVNRTTGYFYTTTNSEGAITLNPSTMQLDSADNYRLSTVIGGGVLNKYELLTTDFSFSSPTAYCNNNHINYYMAYSAVDAYKNSSTEIDIKVGELYSTYTKYIAFSTSISGNEVTFEIVSSDVKNTGQWFVYDTDTETITGTRSVFDEYTEDFYNSYVNTQSQNYLKNLNVYAAKMSDLTEKVDAKFIPIDGTTITVNGNGELTAAGDSFYTHHIILKDNNDAAVATVNITSKQSSAFTMSDLATFLYNKNITSALDSPYIVTRLYSAADVANARPDYVLFTSDGENLLYGTTQAGTTGGATSIEDIVYDI